MAVEIQRQADDTPVCKSTRYGRGCGHPTTDHNGAGDCCCCNWQHNDPGHQQNCIECHRRRYATPGMTAAEFAPFLPAHLRRPYWRQKIGEYCRAEGLDPESPTAPPVAADRWGLAAPETPTGAVPDRVADVPTGGPQVSDTCAGPDREKPGGAT